MNHQEARWIVTFGILALCVFSYWVGLATGSIQCEHRCYWCWKPMPVPAIKPAAYGYFINGEAISFTSYPLDSPNCRPLYEIETQKPTHDFHKAKK